MTKFYSFYEAADAVGITPTTARLLVARSGIQPAGVFGKYNSQIFDHAAVEMLREAVRKMPRKAKQSKGGH